MSEEFFLKDFEREMLDNEHGYPRQWAIKQQLAVGKFFGARYFVEVSQAHVMCDTESLGLAGIEHLEKLAGYPVDQRKVCIPAITDPRGIDLSKYKQLKQPEKFAERERRASKALESMGILMTDTCINYQTVSPPVFGESVAFGDTGSVIYANSVLGARSNFEGGPAALAAALTGRVPGYGYHLDGHRLATHGFHVKFTPQTLSDWGALGAVIGKKTGSYWSTPFISGILNAPTSDQLKHFGAALASYGSVPMFHMQDITPDALEMPELQKNALKQTVEIDLSDIRALYTRPEESVKIDVVVFAAPQLSLFEIENIANMLSGKSVCESTALLIATSPELKSACDRFGLTEKLEQAGAALLSGVCFYQMYARELAEANGWKTLASNSAKLVNIISGYGYEPMLATTEQCVEAAINGVI